jgi:hypothetical protein
MSRSPQPAPSELVLDSARALAAMRLGVREALIDHKRTGDPVVTMVDGQICWIAPEDIVVPDEPA